MELHDLAAEWATDQMIKLFRGAHLGRWCLLQRKLDRRRDERREVVRLLEVNL